MKRLTAILLLFCLSLAGYGAEKSGVAGDNSRAAVENVQTVQSTVEGYVPELVELSENFDGTFRYFDTVGDTVWLDGRTSDGVLAVAGYDTLSGTWQVAEPDTVDIFEPYVRALSAASDSL